jgi:hypothetical protein
LGVLGSFGTKDGVKKRKKKRKGKIEKRREWVVAMVLVAMVGMCCGEREE